MISPCSVPKKIYESIEVFQGAGGFLVLYIRLYEFFERLLKDKEVIDILEDIIKEN
jgi:hypothetical protein